MAPLKGQADIVIDTSDLNIHQLRDRLTMLFAGEDPERRMRVSVMSFGYKHGLPLDVDLVFDCRFLPNPYWVPELRSGTGLDLPVRDYVLGQPDAKEFIERTRQLLELVLPGYEREGKAYCNIAVGCTGGHHRSVVMVEELSKIISDIGYSPAVSHRDVSR